MSQDVMICVMNSTTVFYDVNLEMKSSEFCVKCLDLDAELLNKQNMYIDLSKSYSQLEKHCISLELTIQLNQEMFQKDTSNDNQNALEILEYFENNDLKAQLQAKDTTICQNQEKVFVTTALQNELKKLKGKNVLDNATIITNATTFAPGMFKLDLDPLAPRLLKNRDAHIDYLKYTQEQEDILRGIELLVYVLDAYPNANKPSEKLVVVTPINKVNKVRFSEPLTSSSNIHKQVVQIVLWYLDSGCLKHMTGNRSQHMNFVSKFQETFRFRNDQIVKIMRHNLFSVGQFCDLDFEVSFWKNTRFIRNLDGVDLLSGSRDTKLYTISLDDMLKPSPICLLSKASKTKSLLWHRQLSHLNFGTLNKLAKDGLVRGIPKLKFKKDHLCSTCALGKSKKSPHQPKAEDTNQEKLYLLHMDLCGLMRVESINGKKYILVIVDDYSRFTWVKFLRSKDEAPDAIIKCIKNILVRLNATVRNFRTDNGTKFVNQTIREFYENVGISHQTSAARTLKQNAIVERRNWTLVEAACTISGPGLQPMTPATSSSGLVPNPIPQQTCNPPTRNDWDRLLQPMFDEYFNPPSSASSLVQVAATLRAVDLANSPVSTSIDQDAPSTNLTSQASPSYVRPSHTPFELLSKWTKDHPIANVIEDPSRSISTRKQLQTDAIWCYFDAFLTSVEPNNYKEAMLEPSWINAMQEEIHEFERLQV
ncbi:retrovirus-related pol polyprotein from transposon TNT 1-94 [Tanacetum coccineum]|uniref:Retrovirus-related pol polyprotein from transposon TNT 1-94 n=1 Tax=Tanacetum coccineum TaxID=301880 RepID=A0ABQ5CXL9_9ASTR